MFLKLSSSISVPLIPVLLLTTLTVQGAGSTSKPGIPAWAQFHGPGRNAICTETGLLKKWPESGPKLLWKLTGLGKGYSTVSFSDGKIFTMGDRNRKQFIIAFDLKTRKELWSAYVGPPHSDGGPRSTPTVNGGLVYAIGTDGDLVCVKENNGDEVWRKNFEKDFGGHMMSGWKYSESPLVDGDRCVCTPGGKNGAIVALNKKTGAVIWKTSIPFLGSKGKDGSGYSSIVISEACGIRQYVQLMGRGLIGVAAKDGKFLWNYNRIANSVANISNPVVRGQYVFGSTSYGAGSALVKLTPSGNGGVKAEEVYFLGASTLCNHHGGVVLVGDYLYTGHGHNAGAPICVEFLTGKVMWKERAPHGGSAAVLYADGNLYFLYQKKYLTLVEATPKKYIQNGSFKIPSHQRGPFWAHPVIFNKRLYLRHSDALFCYDIAAE